MRNAFGMIRNSSGKSATLTAGASAIAFAAAMMANPAMAACGTMQVVSSPCEGPVTPASGTFENSSTILLLSDPVLIGVNVQDGVAISTFDNTATGLIDATTTGTAIGTGMEVDGSITTLNNAGQIITNNGYGVYVDSLGKIGTLNNISGALIGNSGVVGYVGVGVYGGRIDTINNAGTIRAQLSGGIRLEGGGSIGAISNSGTIHGGTAGAIDNNGSTIDSINNTGTLTSGYVGIKNSAGSTINSITNSGTITSGGSTSGQGIRNDNSTIGTITNANGGTISSSFTAIANTAGTITTLNNNGTITGDVGIFQRGNSTIGTITNSNLIEATDGSAIDVSDGQIGTITNTADGYLKGGYAGISNSGTITQITNAGLIDGGYAVINEGTMGSVANSGTITSDGSAFVNYGTITTLTNSGTINSDTYAGIYSAEGTIGSITNELGGTVSGASAGVYNSAAITLLTNAGTISSGQYGINNQARLDGVVNSGLITSSGSAAIFNISELGTINNSGTLNGRQHGIFNNNGGTITKITNTGTINGTVYEGIYNPAGTLGDIDNLGAAARITGGTAGIYNSDIAGSITNEGTIQGGTYGIYTSGTMGNITNSGLIDGGYYDGIYINGGTLGNVTNTATGTIQGGTAGIYNSEMMGNVTNNGTISGNSYGIYNSTLMGDVTNTGSIIGTSYYGIYNGETMGSLTNSGTIRGGSYGFYNDGTMGDLNNSGTIEATQTHGIYNVGTIGTLNNSGRILGLTSNAIYNSGGTITTLSNSGTISGDATAIYNAGTITSLVNHGTIAASVHGLVNATESTVDTLLNWGTMGGVISNAGTIGNVTNAQGGLTAGGSLGPLSLTGAMFTGDYVAHITSTTHYAQFAFVDGNGALKSFNLTPDSVLKKGTYQDVLAGITSINGPLSGTAGRALWTLLADPATAGTWDLAVILLGPDVANTLLELGYSRDEVLTALRNRAALMNNALATDCSSFGSTGVCLSFDVRRTAMDEERETSGTFALGVRLSSKLRAGAFVELPMSHSSNLHGVHRGDKKPIFGGYLSYSQHDHGDGLQVRIVGATNTSEVSITRPNALQDTEAGEGHAQVKSWALGAELGYGIKLGAHTRLTPYLGLQRVSVEREAYAETATDTVEYPLSYAAYGQRTTTGRAGAVLSGKLGEKVHYKLGAGAEFDLTSNSDAYAGTSLIDDLPSFSLANTAPAKKFRGTGTAELGYEVLPGVSLSVAASLRGEAFSDKTHASVSGGIRFNF